MDQVFKFLTLKKEFLRFYRVKWLNRFVVLAPVSISICANLTTQVPQLWLQRFVQLFLDLQRETECSNVLYRLQFTTAAFSKCVFDAEL